MRPSKGWMVAALIVTGLALPGCTRTSAVEPAGAEPASIEPVAGSDIPRVVLSSDAARRLDVQVAAVRRAASRARGRARIVIPYAAVLYDPSGDTWVYTSTGPLTFARARISVDRIEGGRAILSSGPSAGTLVVTVGAPELLGVEYRVGEE